MCEGTAVEATNSGTMKRAEMQKAGEQPTLNNSQALIWPFSVCLCSLSGSGWSGGQVFSMALSGH